MPLVTQPLPPLLPFCSFKAVASLQARAQKLHRQQSNAAVPPVALMQGIAQSLRPLRECDTAILASQGVTL